MTSPRPRVMTIVVVVDVVVFVVDVVVVAFLSWAVCGGS